MTTVAAALEKRLLELDAEAAAKLERVVFDLIEFSRADLGEAEKDDKGWPAGYFEETAGCFAGEPFEVPDDPPPSPIKEWR